MTAVKRDQMMKSELAQARLRMALVNVANAKATAQSATTVDGLLGPLRRSLAREIMQGTGATQHWVAIMQAGVMVELDKSAYGDSSKKLSKNDPDDSGKAVGDGLNDTDERRLASDLEAAFAAIYDNYLYMVAQR